MIKLQAKTFREAQAEAEYVAKEQFHTLADIRKHFPAYYAEWVGAHGPFDAGTDPAATPLKEVVYPWIARRLVRSWKITTTRRIQAAARAEIKAKVGE